MQLFYNCTDKIENLYSLLQDALSKQVFWTRMKYDVEPNFENMLAFSKLNSDLCRGENENLSWKEHFRNLRWENKKIFLYGVGAWGQIYGNTIERDGQVFDGFVDRGFEKYSEGLMGKPVISPEELLAHKDEYVLILSTMFYADEIYSELMGNDFPEDHILPYFYKPGVSISEMIERQYFEFPNLFKKGTAFVDAGCYDGKTALRFSRWCGGEHGKIFAFEPDHNNYLYCTKIAAVHRELQMEIFEAGVGKASETAYFSSQESSSCSYVVRDEGATLKQENLEKIQIMSIDDVAKDTEVGFIKMDIEGAEYDALVGAKKTILRDKPLCAISVYHRKGDVLAIMDYLNDLVPEYRFWLRHYSPANSETVLYAAL